MSEDLEVGLVVSITRWVDDSQPGWVEFVLIDAHGRSWSFVEKAPVVSVEDLDAESAYPRPAIIDCQWIERRIDASGSELVVVDTSIPWGIDATSGETRFEVRPDQLVRA